MWNAVSYPSLKSLSNWVDDLKERINFFLQWIDIGPPRMF